MKIAVVFDTPYEGWGDAEFQAEVAAQRQHPDEEGEAEFEVAEALMAYGHEVCMAGVGLDIQQMLDQLAAFQPDLVFNCAEGFRGQADLDYIFPALLQSAGYRYTGSPPSALLLTRNKAMSKKVLAHHGVRVPGFVTYRPGQAVPAAPATLRFPVIVKPLQEDASEGISHASVVDDGDGLAARVAFVHERYQQPAIVEEFIDGRELYVGVVGNGDRLEVLPFTELAFDKEANPPEERIATKHAKWNEAYRERRGIKSVFARPIAQAARERIAATCREAYDALWLRDYARLDIRLTSDNEVFVLEANANPFISFGHEMANAAEKAGMDYYAFIQRIVDEAMARDAADL